MAGFCTLPRVARTWAKAVSARSMTSVPGFAGTIPMISVNTMNQLNRPANSFLRLSSSWTSTAKSVSKNGLAASNFTSKLISRQPWRKYLPVVFCAATLSLQPAGAAAQAAPTAEALQTHIDAAVAILYQLDSLASHCVAALEATADAGQPCSEFLAGVDGELLSQYLVHCQILTDWREQYVTTRFGAGSSTLNSETELATLVGADFACGENALQQRTEYVTTAFNRLQNSASSGRQQNAALTRRLGETEFNATLDTERRRLLQAVQQQQNQREQESERQMRLLENEIIRQQINAPNR